MKRLVFRSYMLVFRHCYSAAVEAEPGAERDETAGRREMTYPTRTKQAAERKAAKREAATGQRWVVVRWDS